MSSAANVLTILQDWSWSAIVIMLPAGAPLMLVRELDPGLFSARWTLPRNSDVRSLYAAIKNDVLSISVRKHAA